MKTDINLKYAVFLMQQQRIAQEVLHQANYDTAQGDGLDAILKALDLEPRTYKLAKYEGYIETDVEVRARIRAAFTGYESW